MFTPEIGPTVIELAVAVIRDPLVVSANTSVMTAIAHMVASPPRSTPTNQQQDDSDAEERSSCIMVVEDNQLQGILTERDIVRLSAQGKSLSDLTLRQVMTRPLITLRESAFTDFWIAVYLFQQHSIRHLPILDGQGYPVGLVTSATLQRAIAQHYFASDQQRQAKCNQAEEKLRHSEAKNRAVLHAIPDLLLRVGLDGSCYDFIPPTDAQAGTFLPIRHNIAEILPPDLLQHQLERIQQAIETGELQVWEHQVWKNGAPHDEEVRLLPCGSSECLLVVRDITERKQLESKRLEAEQALRTSEARYRQIVETANEGIWVLDANHQTSFVNPKMVAMLGYSGDEMLGKTLFDFMDAEGVVIANQYLERRRQGIVEQHDFKFQHKDGSDVWVLISTNPILDEAGQYTGALGMITDIRDRKQIEWALKATNERYEAVIQSIGEGVWELDCRTNVAILSPRYCEIFGYPPGEHRQSSYQEFLQIVHPDDRAAVKLAVEQHWQQHRPYLVECRVRHQSGHYIWIRSRGTVTWDEQGNPVKMAGAIEDISDRKRAEQSLQQTRDRLQEAQRIAHLGNWELNLQTQALYWSDEIFQIFELDPQTFDASYEAFLNAIHPDDRKIVNDAYTQHLRDRTPYNIVHRLLLTDGRIKYVQERCETVFGEDGTPLLSQGTIQDITTRKQAEIALQNLIAGTAATTGQDFFPALAKHIAEALDVTYALVTEWVNDTLQVLAFWGHGTLQAPFSYHPARTPCERTLREGKYYCESMVQQTFPHDLDLVTLGAQSYLGVALRSTTGEPIGNLCILNQQPIRNPQQAESLLRVFAARAASELERERAMAAIAQLNSELETKVKERTLALQHSEARYRALMEGASDAILLGDIQGNLMFGNWKAAELLGYSQDEIAHLHIFQIHPAAALVGVQQHFDSIVRCNSGITHESVILRKDGRQVPVDITGSLIELGDEQIVQGIFRDISDRKRAEQQLQESEAKLQAILNLASSIIYVKDLNGKHTLVNQAFLQLFGCQETDVLGKTNYEFFPPALADHIQANDQELLSQGITRHLEEEMWVGNTLHTFLSNKFLLRYSDGQPYALCGMSTDITDRKHAEYIIRQQAKQEALLREISQRIRQSLDIQTIFDTACQEIRQVIDADRVAIFKFDPESHFDDGEFVAEAVVNGFSAVTTKRVHDHCFGKNYATLYAQGQFFAVNDIYQNHLTACHTDILSQFQVQANLVMPLLCGEHLWGLLCVHQCTATRHWDQFEINLVQQLANQLAIAIQQASLYDQIQLELVVRQQAEAKIALQLRRQETLGAIIQHIRESLDMQEILMIVTQQVKDVLVCDRVIVFRLFDDGSSQIVAEAVSPEFPTLKDRHWNNEVWSQDILDYYWQGKPRIVPDVMHDRWTDCLVKYSIEGRIQSKIVAPILQDAQTNETHRWVSQGEANKLWGVLVVHACSEKRVWQESEAQLLQQIANQLAIAIQQAHLFIQAQQELVERQQAQQLLTERNQQLAISNQELARATRLKDEFLANMSHELRTPLNAILGMTEGLLEQVFGALNPKQIKALNTVDRSATHLLSLINDILDVAKIEAGQIDLECTTVPVLPLCSSSLTFIKQQAAKKNIQIETQLEPNLPNLLVDERRIHQVLINLLTNAVKFTPDGGKVTLVASWAKATNGTQANYLRIAVIDTGIGIAQENIQKLFQPFVQIDSALNRQYTGTGLGLALVKQIVELHGGQVGLTSELGVGSCFTVDLPCAPTVLPTDATTTATIANHEQATSIQAHTQSPLILLAEDNEANISTIANYLEVKGYRVIFAKNGQDAIALAQAEHPDLILMDIQMPGMDGLAAMQHIRGKPDLVHVPIIALTALAMESDRENCLAAGACEYLAKPVRLKHLATVIQSLLSSLG